MALLCALATPQGPTMEARLLQTPCVHGDDVAFNYAGDLWVSKLEAGSIARRLTSAPGNESRPRISPDGKWVAFTAQYDGPPNIYVIPLEGGEPRRVTYGAEGHNCVGWTPDGKIAYVTNAGNFTNRQYRLYTVDPNGGLPTATVLTEAMDGTWLDKDTYVYNRVNSSAFNWRRYRGGTQGRVSIYNFARNEYSEIPQGREQSYFPMAVGRSIFYISDKTLGTMNLYRYDVDSKRITQLTKFNDADVRVPNTDGKTIVYQRDGWLWAYDISSGKIAKVQPRILSENLVSRPQLRALGSSIGGLALSPSGSRLIAEARGELFSVPAKNGETHNLTNTSGARERMPQFLPDGKQFAYFSDETGEYEFYLMNANGTGKTQLTNHLGFAIQQYDVSPDGKSLLIRSIHNALWILDIASKKLTKVMDSPYGIGGTDWSPDSKWIAYTAAGRNQFNSLYLYEVATGKTTHVTEGYYNDGDVAFDGSGKYLYLVSSRTLIPTRGSYEASLKVENPDRVYVIPLAKDTPNPLVPVVEDEDAPKPPMRAPGGPGGPPPAAAPGPSVKIDLEGLGDRAVPLPLPNAEGYGLVGSSDGVFIVNGGNLTRFDLRSKQNETIFVGLLGAFAFNASKTKLAYSVGGVVGVVDVRPGLQAGMGKVDVSGVEAVIDPREEWKQIFWETWRIQRDRFYDKTMGGQDWNAIGKRYAEYLPYVRSRQDLFYLQGLLIGELGTGHEYINPGDPWAPQPRPVPIGYLGVDYVADKGFVKMAKVYRGANYSEALRAPLGEPGIAVKDGEYLLAIDGKKVDATVNPASLLINKVGRTVVIKVNSTPTETGAREIRVRPISDEGGIRHEEYIENNRKWVEKMSGGRIGYMYISDTAAQGSIDFVRGFYPQVDKEAVVVDERWNGGGYIQPWFVDTLTRKIKAAIQVRGGGDEQDAVAIEGPKALLINGYAGSGGDFFPWMFRQAKAGPLIGKRTWGGLVGIQGFWPLIDGGGVTAPAFAIYDRDTNEIIAENRGVDPDIDVDNRPDLVVQGHDPQLEKAVEVLLADLKKNPPRKSRTEPVRVGKDGRVIPGKG